MDKPFVAEIPWAEEMRSEYSLDRPKEVVEDEFWVKDVIQEHIRNISDLLYRPAHGFAKRDHVVYTICSENGLDWKHCLLAIELSGVLRGRGYVVTRTVPSLDSPTFGLKISWDL